MYLCVHLQGNSLLSFACNKAKTGLGSRCRGVFVLVASFQSGDRSYMLKIWAVIR